MSRRRQSLCSRRADGALIPQNTSPSLRPINGQKLCEYAQLPFGWCRFGYNGCVVLSIYNALLLSGYELPLPVIHRMLHRIWKPRFFGVRVWEIRRCLQKLGIPFREFTSSSELTSAMEPGSAAIVMSWNRTVPYCHFTVDQEPLSVLRFPSPFGGAHGVAIEYTAPGQWRVFNRYSNIAHTYTFSSFREFLPFEAAFMKGFLIEKAAGRTLGSIE